jgi:hypothetical protein
MKKGQFIKILFGGLLHLLVIPGLGQQVNSPKTEAVEKGTGLMKTTLNLSEEQAKRFENINKTFIADMDRIGKSNESVLVKSKRRKDLLAWKEEEIKKIFTTEQYQQYMLTINSRRIEVENKRKELLKQKSKG